MTGHTSSVYSLAFSAESTLLVSGSADWTVRTWDVKAAGGLKAKTQQKNGAGAMVNGNGDGGGNGGAGRGPGDEESLETYVLLVFSYLSFFLSVHRIVATFLLIGPLAIGCH